MKKSIVLLQTIVLLLSAGLTTGYAQETEQNENLIFDKQIRFSLSPIVYDNLKIKHQGKKHLKSSPTISGEALISYYNHIYKGYGINIGVGLNVAPYNLNYNFKAPENSIFLTGNNKYEYLDLRDYDYPSVMYVFPISVNKVLPIKNSIFSIDIGAKYQTLMSKDFTTIIGSSYCIDDNNTCVDLFNFQIDDAGKRHIVSYFLKLGIIKCTKKHNSFHFNVVANYSPTKIGKGWYEFYNLGYDSYGTVEQNINYIGFEFVYGLSFSKREFSKN
ncbi:MAG TPA: hypothetical protein PKW37_04420 [Salinivirgaceae bacterium]|mgnify:FL=1|nr:hypothetical protein [Salinivirgaceae bacterium]